jgi:protein TonB
VKAFHFGPDPLLLGGEFRRLLLASLLAHTAVALMFMFFPTSWLSPRRPLPVFVELVASLPEAAIPPAPARSRPQPAAKPRPQQVVDEGVVIPKEPRPEPKPKPEPAPEVQPEPKPKPAPAARPEPPKPAPLTREQILAQLRTKLGSVTPEAVPAPAAAQAGGSGQRVDPLVAAWHSEVRNLMYANWVGARPFRHRSGLEVQFVLDLDPSGRVRTVRLTRTSGLRVLDESAERTIHKVLPELPPAPDGLRTVNVTFDPRDV